MGPVKCYAIDEHRKPHTKRKRAPTGTEEVFEKFVPNLQIFGPKEAYNGIFFFVGCL